jgi:hypothetical protein
MAAPDYYRLPELPAHAKPDDLIIDLRYSDLIERGLDELRITITERDEVPAFDLALLKLRYDTRYVNDFVVDIDAVLAELRWWFAARFGGWTPLLGKNRWLGNQVGAYPQTQSMATPFDPIPLESWSLPAVSNVGRGVRVGVLDTKLYAHPNFLGRYEIPDGTSTLLAAEDAACWENGHGAFVAGLILEQAPGATLVVRDVLDSNGKAPAWDTVKQLGRFLKDEQPVDILNLSIGCRTNDGQPPAILRRAIERLSPHMVIVAAAGNHGKIPGMVNGITRHSPTWPAALPDVIAVSATTEGDTLAAYSPDLPWVTATAKADGVPSTYLHGDVHLPEGNKPFTGYATWRGSSFASAIVSGAIAAHVQPGHVTARDVVATGTAFRSFTWHDTH